MADKVRVVVNRQGADSVEEGISLKKAEEVIGKPIFWQVPNDYRTMVEVRNNGVPLVEQAPKAAVTQSVIGLAEALTGDRKESGPEDETEVKVGKSSLFSFWPTKGKSGK